MYNSMLSFASPWGNLMAFVTHDFGSDYASSEILPSKKREKKSECDIKNIEVC